MFNMDVPSLPAKKWSETEVTAFAESAEPEEIVAVLQQILEPPVDDYALEVLVFFLGARHANTFLKPIPSQLAAQALLSLGRRGIERLVAELLDPDADIRYPAQILATLWHLSRGRGLVSIIDRVPKGLAKFSIQPGADEAARKVIRELFSEARVNPEVFWILTKFLHDSAFQLALSEVKGGPVDKDEVSSEVRAFMALFAEGAIKLSRSVLDEFSALLHAKLIEEEYQAFLTRHPVLLDPLAASTTPKQKLGLDFATDFAVRRHDDRWLLVEIERPHDEVFTLTNDFRERFTHAFGQVLDFQHWVDDNVAYAQKLMPKITSPNGLLVMGMRSSLTDGQAAKLRRFTDNSRRIEVVTFDDLLARANSLYENLLAQT